MTPERQAEIAAFLDARGQWAMADDVRKLNLSGRPKEKRPNKFTARINALADLHFEILSAGGDYRRFVHDDRVADIEPKDRPEFLWKVYKPRNWGELRKCIAARKVADSNI